MPSFLSARKGFSIYVGLSMIFAPAFAGVALPAPSYAASVSISSVQAELPILPNIDASMKARLQAILADGRSRGNRPNVFAKLGDSITESASFLVDNGCMTTETGSYSTLQAVIDYFRFPQPGQSDFPTNYSSAWCSGDEHGSNSFTRSSVAATAGWTTENMLAGAPNAAARELTAMRPGFAILMLGTNDLERDVSVTGFETRLGRILDQVISFGTVPIVSTIPARRDSSEMNARVVNYNDAIVRVARARQIPVLNYWAAMNPLPNQGLSSDGVHPSVYRDSDASLFTSAALQSGYNMRNLTFVQTLEKMKRIVIENGAADAGSSPAPTTPATPVVPVVSPSPVVSSPTTTPVEPTSPTSPTIAPVPTTPSSPSVPLGPVGSYDIGNPVLTDIWVDPRSGNDANTGVSRAQALRSLAAAWQRVPTGVLSRGYRIMVTPGTLAENQMPNYWENRRGTASAPVIVQAADGRGTVTFQGDINAGNLSYFYLIDISIIPVPAGDALHFSSSDHILVRGVHLSGGNRQAHETLKVNQTQYMYVEESDIHGADDNAIDFVAVQYGHVINNKIHDSQDWCMYFKGGSAQLTASGNEIYNCGTGGFIAGQGTGFQYMVAPWIHYEAYDVKFMNNVVHDTETAGLGVNGGYNILFAYNTVYNVTRDHFFEANFGGQGCDPTPEQPACRTNYEAGGWGRATPAGGDLSIPNKHVYVYNNIFANRSGIVTPYILQIASPLTESAANSLSGRKVADEDLQIKGNIFWSNADDLGIGDSTGCASSSPSCNEAQLRRDNKINSVNPVFMSASQADFRLNGALSATIFDIPSFPGGDMPSTPRAAVGILMNGVTTDRVAALRTTANNAPGAYVRGATIITPSTPPIEPTTPTSPTAPTVPTTPPAPTSPFSPSEPTPPTTPPVPVVPVADLSIALFATPYPSVVVGNTISYRATVKNMGPSRVAASIVDISIPSQAVVIGVSSAKGKCETRATTARVTCEFGALSVGQSAVVTIKYRTNAVGGFAPRGDVRLTSSSGAVDNNLVNNSSSVGISVRPVPQANLVASWTVLSQTCRMARAGEVCTWKGRFTEKNIGNKVSGAHKFAMYTSLDDRFTSDDRSVKQVSLSSLGVGQSRTTNFSFTLPVGIHPRYAIGLTDAGRVVNESNENDNVVVTMLP